MPSYIPYQRPPLAGAVFAAVAQPVSRSSTTVSTYTSLDHALGHEGARGGTDPILQPPQQPNQPAGQQMASDGRYIYHGPQDVPAPYAYAPYPPSGYEHPQFAQNMPRPPARSSQTHSPHPPPPATQPYSAPPATYPPPHPPHPYGPPPYAVAPPPGGPWTAENWPHYPPTFPPPQPPPQEGPSPYSTNGTRSEIPPPEHRQYQPGSSRPESDRADERAPRLADAAPKSNPSNPSNPRKVKDPEPPTPTPAPAPPPRSPSLGVDFFKLRDQYGLVRESAAALGHDTQSAIPAEAMERMAQAAAYGAQALESAAKRMVQGDAPRPPDERSPEEPDSNEPKPPPPPSEQPGSEGQTCLGCNATSTPEWRRGPMGPRTLCNACGLVYAKLIKKRNRDWQRTRNTYVGGGSASHIQAPDDVAPASNGDVSSDDDESYGSQDRHSDGGFHGGRD
ncbi:hypothetical protein IEO21_01075 [Rhodonia placenta]|uniref:GATA-type domain-containing protein n=1 Tax=Rhodonia placenta TaxID=104341 RepID=A0A8H7U5N3_9APHY|nr:hypothetical protein IEO21_01075 [Postia placenta]